MAEPRFGQTFIHCKPFCAIFRFSRCLEQKATAPHLRNIGQGWRPGMTSPKLKIAIGVILALVMALPLVG
jgi:hypothetical protein